MTRGAVRDWLKSILWALGFAIGMWYVIDYNTRTTREGVEIALRIEPPTGLTVEYAVAEPPPRARIAINGPRRAVDSWAPKDGVYRIARAVAPEDIGKELRVPITEFNLSLPEDVDLVREKTEPVEVVYRLLETQTAPLKVRGEMANEPPGYRAAFEPLWADARGPRAAMSQPGQVLVSERVDLLAHLEREGWRPDSGRPPPPLRISISVSGQKDTGIDPLKRHHTATIRFEPRPGEVVLKIPPLLAVPTGIRLHRVTHSGVQEDVTVTVRGPANIVNPENKDLPKLVDIYLVPEEGASWERLGLVHPAEPPTTPIKLDIRIGRDRLEQRYPGTAFDVILERENEREKRKFTVEARRWE
jgi:hypothetical protein